MAGSVDKYKGQSGRNATHKTQEISEIIRITQRVEPHVSEGCLVQGQRLPGNGPRNLVKRGPDKVKTGFSRFLRRVFV